MKINIPTWITFFRIALLPLILFFYVGATELIQSEFMHYWGRFIAVILFMLAVASDWLDGYVARKRNEVTDFGKVIDQIADKVLVLLAFLLIVTDPALVDSPFNIMPIWFAVVIVFINIGRDYAVGAVRQISKTVIPADRFGKAKTMFQFSALWLFMLWAVSATLGWGLYTNDLLNDLHRYLAWIMMIAATVLSVLSCVNYILNYRQTLREDGNQKSEDTK